MGFRRSSLRTMLTNGAEPVPAATSTRIRGSSTPIVSLIVNTPAGDRTHVHAVAGLELPQQVRQRVLGLGLGDAADVELDGPIVLGGRGDRHRAPDRAELWLLGVVRAEHAVLPGHEPRTVAGISSGWTRNNVSASVTSTRSTRVALYSSGLAIGRDAITPHQIRCRLRASSCGERQRARLTSNALNSCGTRPIRRSSILSQRSSPMVARSSLPPTACASSSGV